MERRKTMWIPAVAAVAWTGLTIVSGCAAEDSRADSHGYGSGNTVGTDQQGRTDPSRSQRDGGSR